MSRAGWLAAGGAYAERADRHRPQDPDAIAAEIRRLVQSGLKPRDVATALRLDLAQVLTAMREGGGA